MRRLLILQSRQVMLLIFDFFLLNVALYAAFWLRFDGSILPYYFNQYQSSYVLVTAVQLVILLLFGLYHTLWIYATAEDMVRVVLAVTLAVGSALAVNTLFGVDYPRSIYPIIWLLNNLFIGGLRFAFRLWRRIYVTRFDDETKKILLYGAGDAGALVLTELQRHPWLNLYPLGFIDDDPQKWHQSLHGLKVLGGRNRMMDLVASRKVDEVIITMPSAPKAAIRELVENCRRSQVKVKTLPGVYEFLNGDVSVQQIREVQIEDLLGREPVNVDIKQISGYLGGVPVLVTGAGGSIGSELCRQIARVGPSSLLLMDHCENNIYEIHRELEHKHPDLSLVPLVGDVRDKQRVEEIFASFRPQVVFHAAAHKHVPLMEANSWEAVKNNIFGTRNVAEGACAYGAARFVLISTDKAVNPCSVMGATKRAAEVIIQLMARRSNTKFCAVRFGNVLGSRGSVVPLFKEQIARGGPVTVTHPEMVRYFMTIPEAVHLVIQAGAMGRRGEIFVLDMGEPVRILDLARDMIRLSGLEPGKDIEIIFTGVRPGERLCEELLTDAEGVTATRHQRIFVARASSLSPAEIAREVERLTGILNTNLDFLLAQGEDPPLKAVKHV